LSASSAPRSSIRARSSSYLALVALERTHRSRGSHKEALMPRSSYGSGSVYYNDQRARWEGAVDLGRDHNGRRRRRVVTGATEREVVKKVRALVTERELGAALEGDLTITALLDRWLATAVPSRVEFAAAETYRWIVEDHLKPGLGWRKLRALRAEDVESFLRGKARDGYSRSTVQRMRSVLAQALKWGERRGYVLRNAASLAELPVVAKPARESRSLTPDELRAFLAAASGTRLEALYIVMFALGLRPGEATALRWSDVDLANNVIHVRVQLKWPHDEPEWAELKTKRSRRSLALPASVQDALRRHEAHTAAERDLLGVQWPSRWRDLVFVSEAGTPIDRANLRRTFESVAKAAKVGRVRPYDARHTACSLLCDAGVPLEHVADVLGHESTRMASQVYRHAIAPSITAGVAAMDRLLGSNDTEAG
jgi:integrase